MNATAHAAPQFPLAFKDFQPAREALWIEKNPNTALQRLPINPLEQPVGSYSPPIQNLAIDLCGEIFMQRGDLARALLLFKKYARHEEVVICLVAQKKYAEAAAYCRSIPSEGSQYHPWRLTLMSTAQGNLNFWPSYLQLRNRLESDVHRLCQIKALDALDNLLAYVISFGLLNPEVFKLAGRTLMFNGFHVQAKRLLEQAIVTNPLDTEAYFHIAEFYKLGRKYPQARLMLKQVLLMNATYTPAAYHLARLPG
jgi:tetratricopeptide (TPR) repeat protein